MSTIDTIDAPRTASPLSALLRLVARATVGWRKAAMRRETYRALDRLSDRELDDIGLTRDDLAAMR